MNDTYASEKTLEILEKRLGKLKNEQSRRNHRYEIMAFMGYAKKDFINMEREDVEGYLKGLTKANRTPETVRMKLSVLRGMAKECDIALRTNTVNTIYARITEGRDKVEYTREDLADLEDADRLITYALERGDRQLAIIVALALECALPSREIIGLRVGNVHVNDMGQPYLRIGTKKEDYMGNEHAYIKEIPLKPDTAEAINDLVGSREGIRLTDPVFTDRWGRELSPRGLQAMISTSRKAAGIPDERAITLSRLNNLAVVAMRQGGADDEALAEQLGHIPSWITRYNSITKNLELTPVALNHISVRY